MKAPHRLLLASLLLAFPSLSPGELSRETGAIYLEDFLPPSQTVILRVIHPAPIFYQMDGKRRLGTLKVGFDAEIIAIGNKAYMVRAKAQHANVSGWISPQALQAHNGADFVKTMNDLYQRQLVVQEIIKQKQVALGMTLREVQLSLGKPDRLNSSIDGEGKHDTLEYITYERVPQILTLFDDFGFPFTEVVHVSVEIGKVSISLSNDIVQSIKHEEAAGNCASTVVLSPPPPLIF